MVAIPDIFLKDLIKRGDLLVEGVKDSHVQPASIDIPIRPGQIYLTEIVSPKLDDMFVSKYCSPRERLDTSSRPVLEVGKTYLIPGPHIAVPKGHFVRIENKSTSGRLGIFTSTHMLNDASLRADYIQGGYSGQLHFLVKPLAFPIKIKEGDALVQMRLSQEGSGYMTHDDLFYEYGSPRKLDDGTEEACFSMWDEKDRMIPVERAITDNTALLHLDVHRILIQKRGVSEPIVLSEPGKADVRDYWDIVIKNDNEFVLRENLLHLMATKERTQTGRMACWQMGQKTEGLGQHVQTHDAGFGDPGFNAPVTAEVINYSNLLVMHDGQFLAPLYVEKMKKRPEVAYNGHYQKQIAPLPPKQFKDWKEIWSKVATGELEATVLA